jgi:hypothetical protein
MNFETSKTDVIRLGEDRERLSLKLEEYKQRKGNPAVDQRKNRYKIDITQALVEHGMLDREALKEKIKTEEGENFDEFSFNDAVGVIKDYIETGGKNVYGGTGLPERPQKEDIEEGELH